MSLPFLKNHSYKAHESENASISFSKCRSDGYVSFPKLNIHVILKMAPCNKPFMLHLFTDHILQGSSVKFIILMNYMHHT